MGTQMHRKIFLRSTLSKLLIQLLTVLVVTLAAASPKSPSPNPNIQSSINAVIPADVAVTSLKVNTDLVQIPVTVVDKKDQAVEHLSKESFLVYENGVQQTISHFEPGQTPISACLVLDASGSMQDKLHKSVKAIHELLGTAIPDDEYCLVSFSDWPEIIVRMTKSSVGVAAALNGIHPGGWTALLDAIYLSLQEVKRGHNQRKAIVVISDGGDNRSLHTQREIKQLVREADAEVYAIGILSPDELMSHPEEIAGPALMKNVSNQSGGRLFRIHEIDELPAAIAKITTALRHQYVLGYYSKDTRHDGKYRHITIKLDLPKGAPALRAYWRAGYCAPNE